MQLSKSDVLPFTNPQGIFIVSAPQSQLEPD
jgi:hypothetical protein